eukprot:TRINITY_DN6977_c0_g1_i1.p1 TRINITY_DN6977_c0_g1~~TRINITY_DN6977_c0_g1_i1.p1  ORF type:complete len:882 (+),score=282.74 TRINITY_DN6977_c0_g1_i1:101-2746(+)
MDAPPGSAAEGEEDPPDIAYQLWRVLHAASEAPNPMLQFALELKADLAQAGVTNDSDAAIREHLEQKLSRLKQSESDLLQQIERKSQERERLMLEVKKFESTLKHLEETKQQVRTQQRFTETCLRDVTSRESQLRLETINATTAAPHPRLDGAFQGAGGAPQPAAVAGDEAARIDAVLWHLGGRQLHASAVRQSLQDFERFCASCAEHPWAPGTYPAWVRCSEAMLGHLRNPQTLPQVQGLLLRCLGEIARRWNAAVQGASSSRLQLPEPGMLEHYAQKEVLECLVTLLQSVNDEVKAETAALVTAVTVEMTAKEIFGEVGGIHALVVTLNKSANEYVLEKALTCLWHLAMSDVNKVVIREAGGLVAILEMLHIDNDVILENATIALGYLTRDDSNKVAIRQCNGLEKLIATLYYPSDSIQSKAAGALWNCASNTENKVIIRQLGAIAALIDLLGSRSESVQENAAGGLWNCAVDTENKRLVRELGGLGPLIQLLSSSGESVVENASGTLWNCAAVGDNRVAIRKLGGLEPLLKLLTHSNKNIQENAAGAIRNCAINDQNKVTLRTLGGIQLFVELLDKARYSVLEKLTSTLWICSINNDNKHIIREADGFPKLLRVLDHDNLSIREKALGILRNCSTLAENRQHMIQAGTVRKITRVLGGAPEKLTPGMKEYAAATLWNIARDDKESAREEGAMQALLSLLTDNTDAVVENAAGCLLSLTIHDENREYLRGIGGIQELARALTTIENEFILEHLVGTLKNVTNNNLANCRLLRDLDIFPRAVQLLRPASNQSDNVVRETCGFIRHLAQDEECSTALGRVGAVGELAKLVSPAAGASDQVRKAANFALACLVKNPHNRALLPADYVHHSSSSSVASSAPHR